jgi:hypothetical protein
MGLVGVFHRTSMIMVMLEGKGSGSGGVVERRVCCLEVSSHNTAFRIGLLFKITNSSQLL